MISCNCFDLNQLKRDAVFLFLPELFEPFIAEAWKFVSKSDHKLSGMLSTDQDLKMTFIWSLLLLIMLYFHLTIQVQKMTLHILKMSLLNLIRLRQSTGTRILIFQMRKVPVIQLLTHHLIMQRNLEVCLILS